MINQGFQTLQDFLNDPFHGGEKEKIAEYEERYKKFTAQNKIKIVGYTKMDEDYYYYIVVPSNSSNVNYDVVIKFFAIDKAVISQPTLRAYYIQLFSNSPGFMYNYAALYKAKGYLIESLYDKMDSAYADQLPTKQNKANKLSFDSSIYFACKILTENGAKHLNKLGTWSIHKYSPDKFFSNITSFQGIKMAGYIAKEEKKLSSIEKSVLNETKRNNDPHRKKSTLGATKSTGKSSIHRVVKKTGSKIGSRKSTVRKK